MATFLIVDDSKLIRMQMKRALSDAGHATIEAEDADSGLLLAKENADKINVIICDFNMPGKNGLELISDMRKVDSLKETTILMLSTESSVELKQKAKELKVKAWIVKPFNKDNFMNVLEKIVQ